MKIVGTTQLNRLFFLFVLGCVPFVALAQGFLVRPMGIDVTAKRGATYEVPIEIRNVSSTLKQGADVSFNFMGENKSGWYAVEPEKATPAEMARFPQILKWAKVDRPYVELEPLKTEEVKLRFDIPAGAKGLYSGALIVQSRPNPKVAMSIVIRFLIPIVISIEGSAVSRIASISSPVVEFSPANAKAPASLMMGVLTKNSGGGMIHVGGTLDLAAKVGSNWLPATSITLDPRRIIPGGELLIGGKVSKRIPSGHYRLQAHLKSEGQPIPQFAGELDVIGDPNAGALTPDAVIIADPLQLTVEVVPSSMRSSMISLQNPTNDPVTIDFSTSTPKGLAGMGSSTLRGDDLSAATWTLVSPSQITIGPLQTRKVKVSISLPQGSELPEYFARVTGAISRKGEAAGTTSILVQANNKGIVGSPALVLSGNLMLTRNGESGYTAEAAFANVGNVSLVPKTSFDITDTNGISTISHVDASGDSETLLPLATGRYSGAIRLTGIAPGLYALRAQCAYGDKATTTVIPVQVVKSKNGLAIQVVAAAPPSLTKKRKN